MAPYEDQESRCSEGGESVIRLTLGRRLVNLLPVAQRTNASNKWRRRQDTSSNPTSNTSFKRNACACVLL